MSENQYDQFQFEGDEADAGVAAPRLDFMAAGFLVGLSAIVMAASVMLPVPGDLRTAPGLLPFIIAASLGVMAVLLGLSARQRQRAGQTGQVARDGSQDDIRKALMLSAAVAVYILALQLLAFQVFVTAFGMPLVISAFEPVTVIALSAIIHVFWRGPLWITVLVSVFWTLSLSLVFQTLFGIPLPGGF